MTTTETTKTGRERVAQLVAGGMHYREAVHTEATERAALGNVIADDTYRRDEQPDLRGRHCRTCGLPLVVRRSDVADGTEVAHRMEDMRHPDFTPHTAEWA